MNHTRYDTWLLPYLEGALDETRRTELIAELAQNQVLAQELESMRRVTRSLQAAAVQMKMDKAELSESLWPQIQSRLISKEANGLRRREIGWWSGLCAGCAATALIGVAASGHFGTTVKSHSSIASIPVQPIVASQTATASKQSDIPAVRMHLRAGREKPAFRSPIMQIAEAGSPQIALHFGSLDPGSTERPFNEALLTPLRPIVPHLTSIPRIVLDPDQSNTTDATMGTRTPSVRVAPTPSIPANPTPIAPHSTALNTAPTTNDISTANSNVTPGPQIQNVDSNQKFRPSDTQAFTSQDLIQQNIKQAHTDLQASEPNTAMADWVSALKVTAQQLFADDSGPTAAAKILDDVAKSGQLDSLQTYLLTTLAAEPDDHNAARVLAAVYEYRNDNAAALDQRTKVAASQATSEDWYQLARVALLAGKPDVVESSYRKALDLGGLSTAHQQVAEAGVHAGSSSK